MAKESSSVGIECIDNTLQNRILVAAMNFVFSNAGNYQVSSTNQTKDAHFVEALAEVIGSIKTVEDFEYALHVFYCQFHLPDNTKTNVWDILRIKPDFLEKLFGRIDNRTFILRLLSSPFVTCISSSQLQDLEEKYFIAFKERIPYHIVAEKIDKQYEIQRIKINNFSFINSEKLIEFNGKLLSLEFNRSTNGIFNAIKKHLLNHLLASKTEEDRKYYEKNLLEFFKADLQIDNKTLSKLSPELKYRVLDEVACHSTSSSYELFSLACNHLDHIQLAKFIKKHEEFYGIKLIIDLHISNQDIRLSDLTPALFQAITSLKKVEEDEFKNFFDKLSSKIRVQEYSFDRVKDKEQIQAMQAAFKNIGAKLFPSKTSTLAEIVNRHNLHDIFIELLPPLTEPMFIDCSKSNVDKIFKHLWDNSGIEILQSRMLLASKFFYTRDPFECLCYLEWLSTTHVSLTRINDKDVFTPELLQIFMSKEGGLEYLFERIKQLNNRDVTSLTFGFIKACFELNLPESEIVPMAKQLCNNGLICNDLTTYFGEDNLYIFYFMLENFGDRFYASHNSDPNFTVRFVPGEVNPHDSSGSRYLVKNKNILQKDKGRSLGYNLEKTILFGKPDFKDYLRHLNKANHSLETAMLYFFSINPIFKDELIKKFVDSTNTEDIRVFFLDNSFILRDILTNNLPILTDAKFKEIVVELYFFLAKNLHEAGPLTKALFNKGFGKYFAQANCSNLGIKISDHTIINMLCQAGLIAEPSKDKLQSDSIVCFDMEDFAPKETKLESNVNPENIALQPSMNQSSQTLATESWKDLAKKIAIDPLLCKHFMIFTFNNLRKNVVSPQYYQFFEQIVTEMDRIFPKGENAAIDKIRENFVDPARKEVMHKLGIKNEGKMEIQPSSDVHSSAVVISSKNQSLPF